MIKPFWVIESDYWHEYNNFEYDCEHATNLKDALACGANMVWVDDEEVGWQNEDGSFTLYEKFKMSDEELANTKVVFNMLTRDEDGFSVAHYYKVEE